MQRSECKGTRCQTVNPATFYCLKCRQRMCHQCVSLNQHKTPPDSTLAGTALFVCSCSTKTHAGVLPLTPLLEQLLARQPAPCGCCGTPTTYALACGATPAAICAACVKPAQPYQRSVPSLVTSMLTTSVSKLYFTPVIILPSN